MKECDRSGIRGSVVHSDGWGAQDGYIAGTQLLESRAVSAILAANVPIATGVIRAAFELDLKVPEDRSIVAMHDSREAQLTIPALTTVTTPIEELGATAVNLLVTLIDGKAVPKLTMVSKPVSQVVVRQSTGPYRGRRQ